MRRAKLVEGIRRGGSAAAGLLAGLRFAAPIWVPCLLFAQIALLGLRPALAERARLFEARAALEARHAAELEVRRELARALRAHHDPIYVARRERSLLDPRR